MRLKLRTTLRLNAVALAAAFLMPSTIVNAQNGAVEQEAGSQFTGQLSTAGAQAIDERRFSGQQTNEYAGGSVSSAGDVNGDGYDDMIGGAANANGGGTERGQAYIFFGSATPANRLVNTADVILSGEADLDDFGYSVSGAGDVNGDGYHDVIVVGHLNDAAGNDAGRAYIFFGGSSMDAMADVVLSGEAAGDFFGFSVSGGGDINGDGFSDVIVGAYSNGTAGNSAGRAYVFFGDAAMDAVADVTFTGTTGDDLGCSVADVGDIDNDGFSDVVVGACGAGASSRGEAYVYLGDTSMNNTADVIVFGRRGADAVYISHIS
jgi:hypothetical protein